MADQIYIPLEGTIRVTNEQGDWDELTCVLGENSCYGCHFKREAGRPQYPFCKAVVCGAWERMDGNDVIFQQIKQK